MKGFIIMLITALTLSAHSKNAVTPLKKNNTLSYKSDAKARMTMMKLRYSLTNSKQINLKCEVKLPVSPNVLLLSLKRPLNNRFQNKSNAFNPRFDKLDQLDINLIVAKNKFYNIAKTGVNIKTF